jgi:hypothetical protein
LSRDILFPRPGHPVPIVAGNAHSTIPRQIRGPFWRQAILKRGRKSSRARSGIRQPETEESLPTRQAFL